MGDTCTAGNEQEHVVFRQAVHVMVHIYAAWRAAGEENFGRFKWFQAVSSVFWSFPARPLPSFVIFLENRLVAFVNVTVC